MGTEMNLLKSVNSLKRFEIRLFFFNVIPGCQVGEKGTKGRDG